MGSPRWALSLHLGRSWSLLYNNYLLVTSICALEKQIAKYFLKLVGQVVDFFSLNVVGVGA